MYSAMITTANASLLRLGISLDGCFCCTTCYRIWCTNEWHSMCYKNKMFWVVLLKA